MAKIRFKCACGKTLAVDERHAGKVAKCPGCQRPLHVPELKDAPAPDEIVVPQSRPSLRQAYGEIMEQKSRRARVNAALDEYRRRAVKRTLIVAGSIIGAVLLCFFVYEVFIESYGIDPDPDECPAATRPFLWGLSREDPLDRAAASWEVADAGGQEVASLISQMAGDGDPLVAVVAVRALGRIDPEGVSDTLGKVLDGGARDPRLSAAFVAAECSRSAAGPTELAPWLGRALQGEKSWSEWYEGISGRKVPDDKIEEFRGELRTFFKGRCASPDAGTRAMWAWMIAATLGPDPTLLSLLRDPDPEVVVSGLHAVAPFLTAAALKRLEEEPNAEAAVSERLDVLNNVAQRLRHDDPRVRRAAAVALSASGHEFSARALQRALGDDDWFVRFAALKGLAGLDPKLARRMLRTATAEVVQEDNVWVQRMVKVIEDRAGDEPDESEEQEEEHDEDEWETGS